MIGIELSPRPISRVHIVGGPGSGKSTLALRLGHGLKLPVVCLDDIAYEGPESRERPLATRLAEAAEVACRPEWIAEGIHVGWTDVLFQRADVIVWLDYASWRQAFGRIIKRFLRGALEGVKRHRGRQRFTRFRDYASHLRQLGYVYLSSRQYYGADTPASREQPAAAVSRASTELALQPYLHKTVHCRGEADVAAITSALIDMRSTWPHLPPLPAQPRVSIVIDNYNYGRYVGEAIQSALDQDYPNTEIIVVDDGSTDGSRAVIEEFGERIVAIFKENGGQASAVNAGVAASSGDILIVLDADDRLLPATVHQVVGAFVRNPGTAKVQYRMEIIDAEGRVTRAVKPDPHVPLRSGDLRRYVLTFPGDLAWMAMSGNAFAMAALEHLLPIPEGEFRMCADSYLVQMAPLMGKVVTLRGIGAQYRVHSANRFDVQRFSLDHVRQSIRITTAAHRHIHRVAAQRLLGAFPADPLEVPAVSFAASRLISLRLEPDRHPVPDDSVFALVLLGMHAATLRFDISPLMRIALALWVLLMAVVPLPVLRWMADLFEFPSHRRILNPLLAVLHRR